MSAAAPVRRVVVGITGASGILYGIRTLECLRRLEIETHLVMTRAAHVTLTHELPWTAEQVKDLASVHYIGAAIASGSFRTMGMMIAPCSIKSLSEIATSVTGGLLSRAADVTLKERRPLVLMVRETPLHLGHLRSMTQVTEMGAIVMPPVPAFYAKPESIDDIVDHSVGRMLDLLGLDSGSVRRWGS
jgi:4-hydroxy-3-polyprenylbenzoate decarboxylase